MEWFGAVVGLILVVGFIFLFIRRVVLLLSGVPLKARYVWLVDDAKDPPNETEVSIWASGGMLGIARFEGIRVRITWVPPNEILAAECENLANQRVRGLRGNIASSVAASGGLAGGVVGAALGGAVGGALSAALGPKTPQQLNVWLTLSRLPLSIHLREREAGFAVMLPVFKELGVDLVEKAEPNTVAQPE